MSAFEEFLIDKSSYFADWRQDAGNRVRFEEQEQLVDAVNFILEGLDPDGEFEINPKIESGEQLPGNLGEGLLFALYEEGASTDLVGLFIGPQGGGTPQRATKIPPLTTGEGLLGVDFDGTSPQEWEVDQEWDANFASLSIAQDLAIDFDRNATLKRVIIESGGTNNQLRLKQNETDWGVGLLSTEEGQSKILILTAEGTDGFGQETRLGFSGRDKVFKPITESGSDTWDFGEEDRRWRDFYIRDIYGRDGDFTGRIEIIGVDEFNNYIGSEIFSDWFSAAPQGWRVTNTGVGDFRSLFIDELIARGFTVDVAQALAGSDVLTKSVSILGDNFDIPATIDPTGILIVEDLPGFPSFRVFQNDDWIRLRIIDRNVDPQENDEYGLVIADVWGTVQFANTFNEGDFEDGFNSVDGTQAWNYTVDFSVTTNDWAADNIGLTVFKGSIALDYGQSGDSFIERTVLDRTGDFIEQRAPYDRIVRWTGSNPVPGGDTEFEILTQRGNLLSITELGLTSPEFGAFFKDSIYIHLSNGLLKIGKDADGDGRDGIFFSSENYWLVDDQRFRFTAIEDNQGIQVDSLDKRISMYGEFNSTSKRVMAIGPDQEVPDLHLYVDDTLPALVTDFEQSPAQGQTNTGPLDTVQDFAGVAAVFDVDISELNLSNIHWLEVSLVGHTTPTGAGRGQVIDHIRWSPEDLDADPELDGILLRGNTLDFTFLRIRLQVGRVAQGGPQPFADYGKVSTSTIDFFITNSVIGLNDRGLFTRVTPSIIMPLTGMGGSGGGSGAIIPKVIWDSVTEKPFSSIGTNLEVISDALKVVDNPEFLGNITAYSQGDGQSIQEQNYVVDQLTVDQIVFAGGQFPEDLFIEDNGDWIVNPDLIKGGIASEVAWDDITGKPSTFTPSSHTHNADDINAGTLHIDRIPTITNAKLQNSTISGRSLGTDLLALMAGSALEYTSGTSYNGSESRTIRLADTAVTPGSFGSTIAVGTFTVDAKGRLTAASNQTIRNASASQSGVVSTGTQTFAGAKSFNSAVNIFGDLTLGQSGDSDVRIITFDRNLTSGGQIGGTIRVRADGSFSNRIQFRRDSTRFESAPIWVGGEEFVTLDLDVFARDIEATGNITAYSGGGGQSVQDQNYVVDQLTVDQIVYAGGAISEDLFVDDLINPDLLPAGGGGGDALLAGNNTWTGTNTFQGEIKKEGSGNFILENSELRIDHTEWSNHLRIWRRSSTDDVQLRWGTGSVNLMLWKPSGNVDIQTGALQMGGTTFVNNSRDVFARDIEGRHVDLTGGLTIDRTTALNHLIMKGAAGGATNPREWRIGFISSGGETNWGIRDATADGNPFPFWIKANSPSSQLVVNPGGVSFGSSTDASEAVHSFGWIRADSGYKVGSTTTIDSNRRIFSGNGSQANPAYSFSVDTGTGFYRAAAGVINFSSGGTQKVAMRSDDFLFNDISVVGSFTGASNQIDLGATDRLWRDLHVGRDAFIGGSVGIGTDSPGAKLTVHESGSSNLGISISSTGSNYGSIGFVNDGNPEWAIGSRTGDGNFYFSPDTSVGISGSTFAGNAVVTIQKNGNVEIGGRVNASNSDFTQHYRLTRGGNSVDISKGSSELLYFTAESGGGFTNRSRVVIDFVAEIFAPGHSNGSNIWDLGATSLLWRDLHLGRDMFVGRNATFSDRVNVSNGSFTSHYRITRSGDVVDITKASDIRLFFTAEHNAGFGNGSRLQINFEDQLLAPGHADGSNAWDLGSTTFLWRDLRLGRDAFVGRNGRILGSGNTSFSSPGELAVKGSTSNPFLSFHAGNGDRIGFLQGNNSTNRVILNASTAYAIAISANNQSSATAHFRIPTTGGAILYRPNATSTNNLVEFRSDFGSGTDNIVARVRVGGDFIGNDFEATSDIRQKFGIDYELDGLDVIRKLRPATYVKNNREGSGFIAQEIREVLPFLVSKSGEYLTLNYDGIIAWNTRAIQQVDEHVIKVNDRVTKIEKQIEELQRELEQLRAA